MTWNTRYSPPEKTPWIGRNDLPEASCIFQIIQMFHLLETPPKKTHDLAFALLGFVSDTGIERNHGRPGAKDGPAAIRASLAKLPIHRTHLDIYDAGNIVCLDGNLESAQEALAEAVNVLLQQDITPILLGGGHDLAFGHYQGIAKAFPTQQLGILNFDAHLDMRPLLSEDKGSSGTPFLQIAKAHQTNHRQFDYNCIGLQHTGNIRLLLETAKKYLTKIIWADELHLGQLEKCHDFIDRIVDQNEIIYLSLCLDVFASAFAPGVSAAQPLGLYPWHVIPLLRQLASSGKVISYDVAELSPCHDIDNTTAKLAAMLIYECIHHHSKKIEANANTLTP